MPARFTEQFTRSVPIHSAVLTKYSHEDIPILVENQKRRILKSPFFFRDETVIRAIINSILFSLLFIYFFLRTNTCISKLSLSHFSVQRFPSIIWTLPFWCRGLLIPENICSTAAPAISEGGKLQLTTGLP